MAAFEIVLQGLRERCIREIDPSQLPQDIKVVTVDGNVERVAGFKIVCSPEDSGVGTVAVRLEGYHVILYNDFAKQTLIGGFVYW
jgi:hypothetical protein